MPKTRNRLGDQAAKGDTDLVANMSHAILEMNTVARAAMVTVTRDRFGKKGTENFWERPSGLVLIQRADESERGRQGPITQSDVLEN